jgi:hypothetical protein
MSSSTGFGTGSFGTSNYGSIPFGDTADLIDQILRVTGHPTPSSEPTKRAQILIFINTRYQQICMDSKWAWLHAQYDVNLKAPYTEGTASAENGSYDLVGVGTEWSTNLEQKNLFWFSGGTATYHVSDVDSQTELSLESKFSEDDLDDATYTAVQNQYRLPVEVDQLKQIVVNGGVKVELVGPDELSIYKARDPQALGTPRFASLIRRDTDDDATYVEFYPSPDRSYTVEIGYSVRIYGLEDAEDCYPIIPDRYRACLFYGACADFATITLKNPTIGQAMQVQFNSFYGQMKSKKEITDQDLRLMPQRNYVKRATRGRRQGFWGINWFGRVDD